LVGVSRKRFIGEITLAASPADRLAGTIGANVAARWNVVRDCSACTT
jgi:dihydropteroate synthase